MRLIIILGPPAVGKMTVGQALAAETGYVLFHNHVTIEPLLKFFPFGSAPFVRLNGLFRAELFAEIARSDHKGLIFTYVWDLADPRDRREIERFIASFSADLRDVAFVELASPQATRLARNETPNRLAHKESKRDLAWSAGNLRECDETYTMNTGPDLPFFYPDRHLKIDNSAMLPQDVALRIKAHFAL